MVFHKPTKIILGILIVMILAFAVVVLANYRKLKNPSQTSLNSLTTNSQPMQITSSAFLDGQTIPPKYTCDGDGINPPLQFSDVPQNAQTLALIVEDPDAPNGTWMHWILWDIPSAVTSIAENSLPDGAMQGQTSSGQNVYGGPCPPRVDSNNATTTRVEAGPPSGTHHYIFTLYALDTKLSIPTYSTADKLREAMQSHVIVQAQITGLYSRNK